jgi:Ca2+-binding RTX toxin-like protein
MTTTSLHLSRRRLAVSALAATATLAAGALSVDRAAAAPSSQVLGTVLFVEGDRSDDRIALRLEAGVPTNLQVDFGDDGVADATYDRATFTQILVKARRGDDTVRIDEVNGVFTDTEATTMDGGYGDDTLLGGRGNEIYFGGPENDVVDGNAGNDIGFMGDGNDAFIWDPGDGNDVIEGQRGYDTMDFRGSGGNELFDASANGNRLRFFRNLGNIVMDTNDVEVVKLSALGGTDTATINDLRGTDVRRVWVDLGATLGAAGGDGQADAVIVNATADDDTVEARPKNGRAVVSGLTPTVSIVNAEAANDTLTLNMLGGDDAIRLGNGLSSVIKTSVNA